MARGVESGDHAPMLIEHRHGQCHDSVGQLVLDGRVPAAAAVVDELAQTIRIHDGLVGEGLEARRLEVAVRALQRQSREQYAPGRGRMSGKMTADMGFEPQQRAHGRARHVDDLGAIQHTQRGRVRGEAGKLLEARPGELFDVHRFEVRGAQLQHFRPEQEVAAVAGDITELFEREQAAPRSRRGHCGAAGDFRQSQCGVIPRERADDREPLGESPHRLAPGRRLFFSQHGWNYIFDMRKVAHGGSGGLTATSVRYTMPSSNEQLFAMRKRPS